MQHISDSKIGTIHSKPNMKYPMIRLPQEYSEIIGQRAHVYKTDHEGQPAFLVVPYTQESPQLTAEPKSRVAKLGLGTVLDSRLSALESQIAELKSLLILNEGDSLHKNKKRWALGDSNAQPSPCKGEGLELSAATPRREIEH
jgi:hypothetical protein